MRRAATPAAAALTATPAKARFGEEIACPDLDARPGRQAEPVQETLRTGRGGGAVLARADRRRSKHAAGRFGATRDEP